MSAGRAPRVLLLRLSALGDVVLATAAARALRAQRPDLAVTFLTREDYAPLLWGQPWADEVWALPRAARGPSALAAWRARLREAGFAAVVDLQTSPRSRALTAFHPRRLAWRAARWQRRRWVSFRFTRPSAVRPAWLRFVDALAPLGVDAARAVPPRLEVDPAQAARAVAEDAPGRAGPGAGPDGGAARPLVFLAPGARWASKRWPEESWLALARAVVRGGGRVLVGGDEADRAALPALAAWAAGEPLARWFAGPLPALAARVARAGAAVTNDTGLGHLAGAVGVPGVTIFGSTHPALGFAPAGPSSLALARGLSCQPCTLHGRAACPLGHHRCVRELSPEEVRAALWARLPGLAEPAAAPAEG